MEGIVARLIDGLESGSEIDRIILEIAMLLEMNTHILYGTQYDAQMYDFDEELSAVRLSVEEQTEIVEELVDYVLWNINSLAKKHCASVIWAMGKACAEAGLPGLIKMIKHVRKEFDCEMSYQSVIALDNFVIHCMENHAEKLLKLDSELWDFLRAKSKSHDEKLSENADRVMKKLDALLNK